MFVPSLMALAPMSLLQLRGRASEPVIRSQFHSDLVTDLKKIYQSFKVFNFLGPLQHLITISWEKWLMYTINELVLKGKCHGVKNGEIRPSLSYKIILEQREGKN